jgi:hypothetical protein
MSSALARAGVLVACGALGTGAVAPLTRAAAAVRHVIQPVAGDWEGIGPHGLRMSFDLVGRGSSARERAAAVSLPNGCRSGGPGGFATVALSSVRYYPPTRSPELIPSVFTIKPPGMFALVGVDSDLPKYPIVITGSFRTRHSGLATVPAGAFTCPPGQGWSRHPRFVLRPARRTRVPDGTYTGSVSGPPTGITGTILATVTGGGRVLTDLRVAWTCPDGSGNFELGPTRAAGEFVGPDGTVEERWTPDGSWSGVFGATTLEGTFTNAATGDCTQATPVHFAATLSSR